MRELDNFLSYKLLGALFQQPFGLIFYFSDVKVKADFCALLRKNKVIYKQMQVLNVLKKEPVVALLKERGLEVESPGFKSLFSGSSTLFVLNNLQSLVQVLNYCGFLTKKSSLKKFDLNLTNSHLLWVKVNSMFVKITGSSLNTLELLVNFNASNILSALTLNFFFFFVCLCCLLVCFLNSLLYCFRELLSINVYAYKKSIVA